LFPALYAIIDPAFALEPPVDFASKLVDAGVELIQLRDKQASARKAYDEASQLVARVPPRGVRIIVNDRPDIAAMVGAGGVHVGQEDLPVEEVRRICGRSLWVGISTHNIEQFREATLTSADYIAVGPIFPTAAKENPDPVVGIDFVPAVRKLTPKPIVAIGGITVESAADVFRAGADSVAVIRDLLSAPDPVGRAREYLEIARRVRAERA
jgi:thiamine-phosphate pyrophosphorylase